MHAMPISSNLSTLTYILALLAATTYLTSHCEAANVVGAPNNGPRLEIKPAVSPVLIEAQIISNRVLTCKALGDKPGMFGTLRWTGPNNQQNWQELQKRHIVKEIRGGQAVELQFQRPTPDDSGVYYCLGTYQSSDSHDANVTVKVYNPIKLENCPDRQYVVEGEENQRITCRMTGDSPMVLFYKDDRLIESTDERYKWDNDDELLILGRANKQDAGLYQIEITADLTGEKKIVIIDVAVHSKPEIVPYVPPVNNPNAVESTGVEGESAELKCQVTGTPRPLVYWLDLRSRNLTHVGGYTVNAESGTLLISKVNRVDDNGVFQCLAINDVGNTKRDVQMMVLQRPAIVAFENKTIDENEEVTFECRATGSPKPVITIRKQGLDQLPYRLGDGLVTDIDESPEGGGAEVTILRLKMKAQRSHSGLHYCNATNQAGSAERVGQLLVRSKPDLSQTPIEQFVKLGRNISVTCHIKAYPTPIVSWYGENHQIINTDSTNFKTSPDGLTHTVTMMPPPMFQGNNARLTCQAKNALGESYVTIIPRYITRPGMVNAVMVESTPTTVKLMLTVSSDGGDRVKAYVYKAEGVTMDQFNPLSGLYPPDIKNESHIDASPTESTYIIRNLFPYYKYRISIRAVNDVDAGDLTEIHAETRRPTRPEPPVIIKPGSPLVSQASSGYLSDYNNGYLLKWSPPELDNGDPVTKYVIRFRKVDAESTDSPTTDDEERIIEQMNERPMHARIWPMEVNQRYRIQLQARNKYGDSEAASIVVFTASDRPAIANGDPLIMSWLMEPSPSVLIALPVLAILAMILIDVAFCYKYQMGVSHAMKNCCCPAKPSSVISDRTFT